MPAILLLALATQLYFTYELARATLRKQPGRWAAGVLLVLWVEASGFMQWVGWQ
jgi:hypothetical protein